MKEENTYEVAVIGAGPGGYVAAIRAAQLGKKVVVIEKDNPGGVCVNIGCIPSKSLIHQVQSICLIPALEKLGFSIENSGFQYASMFKQSRKVATRLSKGVAYLLKKNNIAYIQDTAVISSPDAITLSDNTVIRADNIIIATGSRPREITAFPFNGTSIISSNNALMASDLPEKVAIIGSGAIGLEFSYIYNALGVEVHLIELMDQLLPAEDEDLADLVYKLYKKKGINIYIASNASLTEKNPETGLLHITITGKETSASIDVDKILVAVGRIPNTEGIGLENIAIKVDNGCIPVSAYYQTSVPGVFAIGDVINSPQLAHVASKEGEIVAEYIAGKHPEPSIAYDMIPFAVYSEPQIASFGPKERDLQKEGIEYEKALFPYRGSGKAVAVEQQEGFVKVLCMPGTKEILSVQIIGANATEMLHEALLAKQSNLVPGNIASMIHAHPTLSESLMEAMRAIDHWAIHM